MFIKSNSLSKQWWDYGVLQNPPQSWVSWEKVLVQQSEVVQVCVCEILFFLVQRLRSNRSFSNFYKFFIDVKILYVTLWNSIIFYSTFMNNNIYPPTQNILDEPMMAVNQIPVFHTSRCLSKCYHQKIKARIWQLHKLHKITFMLWSNLVSRLFWQVSCQKRKGWKK